MKTEKLFLTNPLLHSCLATVIAIDPLKGISLDKTVSYALSGGQESDHGFLQTSNGIKIHFTEVTKQSGRSIFLADFPCITVDNLIWIKISPAQIGSFYVGQLVELSIDIKRRAELSQSHTGTHIFLQAGEELGLLDQVYIRGCSISCKKSRLDFFIKENKLSDDEINKIEVLANELIGKWLNVKTYPHHLEPEAFYWQINSYKIPCGGTHLTNSGLTGRIVLKKKNLGASMQRIEATFPDSVDVFTSMYHSY